MGYRAGHVEVGPQPFKGPRARYNLSAHVAAFMNAWGPVPKGMIVRHTCDNRACINPMHLQIGTHADNMRDMATRGRHPWVGRPACKRGHEFTPENTYRERGNPASRRCRACHAQDMRNRRASNES